MAKNLLLSPRQIAGKLNQLKRGSLTAAGRQRLHDAALTNRPWRFSTGPKSAAGKVRAAANGKVRQTRELSVREIRAATADVRNMIHGMSELPRLMAEASNPPD